jgi:hypothetical protein
MIIFFSRLFRWTTEESKSDTFQDQSMKEAAQENYSNPRGSVFTSSIGYEDIDDDSDDDYREPNPNYIPMDDYDSCSWMYDPDNDYD